MAQNTTKEEITIVELGKWGVKSGTRWYYYGKFLEDDAKAGLVPGRTVWVDIWTSNTGKEYINKVLGEPTRAAEPAPTKAPSVQEKPKTSGQRDFDAEAMGKTRCAAITAALQSPAGVAYSATEQEYVAFIVRMADEAVKYTFKG